MIRNLSILMSIIAIMMYKTNNACKQKVESSIKALAVNIIHPLGTLWVPGINYVTKRLLQL